MDRPPVTDFATDFDHCDPTFVADPYPVYDALREQCPIAHTDRYHGVWIPTRYADLAAIAHDHTNFSSHTILVKRAGRVTSRTRVPCAADHRRPPVSHRDASAPAPRVRPVGDRRVRTDHPPDRP